MTPEQIASFKKISGGKWSYNGPGTFGASVVMEKDGKTWFLAGFTNLRAGYAGGNRVEFEEAQPEATANAQAFAALHDLLAEREQMILLAEREQMILLAEREQMIAALQTAKAKMLACKWQESMELRHAFDKVSEALALADMDGGQ